MLNKQYAVQQATDAQKIRELRAIGFWRGAVPEQATWRVFVALIRKTQRRGLSSARQRAALDTLKTIHEASPSALADGDVLLPCTEFLYAALQLLGYRAGKDFNTKTGTAFAQKMGLALLPQPFTGRALLAAFYDLLCHKGATGQSLLDIALQNGALARYNMGRKMPKILLFNGKTQPVFNPAHSITERVYVETSLDTDQDGRRDRIAVYIRRPAETEQGLCIPALYIANPYAAGWNDDAYKLHGVDMDLPMKPPAPQDVEATLFTPENTQTPPACKPTGQAARGETAPEFDEIESAMGNLVYYFLPRGFAAVYAPGIGTRHSDGIRTCGSPEETSSTTAVIEWLTGARRAFTSRTGTTQIKADWCNGNVGMSGKSYLGTLSIAAAATGVQGLKTAIVESAISDWYRYYRENGTLSPALDWQGDDADLLADGCLSRRLDPSDWAKTEKPACAYLARMQKEMDRETGNYNRFWDERNYLKHVGNTKANIYIVHGLNDWNVKPIQFARYWEALQRHGVPSRLLLHQGAHIYINNNQAIDYYDMMNLWLTHHLWEVDNAAETLLPPVLVQDNRNSALWHEPGVWPAQSENTVFYPAPGGLLATQKSPGGSAAFTDDVDASGFRRKDNNLHEWREAFVAAKAGTRKDVARFTSPPLQKNMRISGTIHVKIRAALDKPTGILSAMAVEYGEARRLLEESETTQTGAIPFGYGWRKEDLVDFRCEKSPGAYRIISRGHLNAQNKSGICGADEIKPGEAYLFEFDLHPVDYTLLKNHRLGILLYGTDIELTQRPYQKTTVTLYLAHCEITLPVVQE